MISCFDRYVAISSCRTQEKSGDEWRGLKPRRRCLRAFLRPTDQRPHKKSWLTSGQRRRPMNTRRPRAPRPRSGGETGGGELTRMRWRVGQPFGLVGGLSCSTPWRKIACCKARTTLGPSPGLGRVLGLAVCRYFGPDVQIRAGRNVARGRAASPGYLLATSTRSSGGKTRPFSYIPVADSRSRDAKVRDFSAYIWSPGPLLLLCLFLPSPSRSFKKVEAPLEHGSLIDESFLN